MYRFNSHVWRPFKNRSRIDPRGREAAEQIKRCAPETKGQYPFQAADIARWLDHARPTRIVELGAGQTTPFFAYWAQDHDAEFVSFEQDERWKRLVEGACPARIVLSEVIVADDVRYAEPIPDCDFLYVDGPASPPGRKPVCRDAIDLLDRCRPAVVMFEGRTKSVDAFRDRAEGYRFFPEFIWAHQRRDWANCLAFRRHSVFLREDAN